MGTPNTSGVVVNTGPGPKTMIGCAAISALGLVGGAFLGAERGGAAGKAAGTESGRATIVNVLAPSAPPGSTTPEDVAQSIKTLRSDVDQLIRTRAGAGGVDQQLVASVSSRIDKLEGQVTSLSDELGKINLTLANRISALESRPQSAVAGGSNTEVPLPPTVSSQTHMGVTVSVVRTHRTTNGIAFEIRVTSPDRAEIQFDQQRNFSGRWDNSWGTIDNEAPVELRFGSSPATAGNDSSWRKVVNPNVPWVFFALARTNAANPATCRELQLITTIEGKGTVPFVLTSFPLTK